MLYHWPCFCINLWERRLSTKRQRPRPLTTNTEEIHQEENDWVKSYCQTPAVSSIHTTGQRSGLLFSLFKFLFTIGRYLPLKKNTNPDSERAWPLAVFLFIGTVLFFLWPQPALLRFTDLGPNLRVHKSFPPRGKHRNYINKWPAGLKNVSREAEAGAGTFAVEKWAKASDGL